MFVRLQYDPTKVKVARFDTPTLVTRSDSTFVGPSAKSLSALDELLAKNPRLRIRRTAPGEYILWRAA